MEALRTDVAIIGGGLGACAAAFAAARLGCRVILTEETHWLGGLLYWTQTEAPRPDGGVGYPRVENLLPGGKNLDVTHITNGAFRVHPIEWNAGEAAGLLAAFCRERKAAPGSVRSRPELLEEFQALLRREGIELSWPKLQPV